MSLFAAKGRDFSGAGFRTTFEARSEEELRAWAVAAGVRLEKVRTLPLTGGPWSRMPWLMPLWPVFAVLLLVTLLTLVRDVLAIERERGNVAVLSRLARETTYPDALTTGIVSVRSFEEGPLARNRRDLFSYRYAVPTNSSIHHGLLGQEFTDAGQGRFQWDRFPSRDGKTTPTVGAQVDVVFMRAEPYLHAPTWSQSLLVAEAKEAGSEWRRRALHAARIFPLLPALAWVLWNILTRMGSPYEFPDFRLGRIVEFARGGRVVTRWDIEK